MPRAGRAADALGSRLHVRIGQQRERRALAGTMAGRAAFVDERRDVSGKCGRGLAASRDCQGQRREYGPRAPATLGPVPTSRRRPRASTPSEPAPPVKDTLSPVDEQLERVLRSVTFQQADRLKRFLTFIVQETSSGRASELKEYVIGVQVFRKEDSFDPRTDPIVRVQARRLRAKLVQYYREEGATDPLTIELPKGGYSPLIKGRETLVLAKRTVGTALISRNTIAVLPFADHSTASGLDAFCKGLREAVVHHLTKLPGLRILARRDEPDTGAAALVIEGSV